MLRHGQVRGTFGIGCRAARTFTPEETAWLQAKANALAEAMGLEE
jgi:hypothetical protein